MTKKVELFGVHTPHDPLKHYNRAIMREQAQAEDFTDKLLDEILIEGDEVLDTLIANIPAYRHDGHIAYARVRQAFTRAFRTWATWAKQEGLTDDD